MQEQVVEFVDRCALAPNYIKNYFPVSMLNTDSTSPLESVYEKWKLSKDF